MGRKNNTVVGAKDYIVEKIVGHRQTKNGKYEYFLKWENWPSETNTWEPEEHLHCHELLAEYKKTMVMNEGRKTAENKDNSLHKRAKESKFKGQENTLPADDSEKAKDVGFQSKSAKPKEALRRRYSFDSKDKECSLPKNTTDDESGNAAKKRNVSNGVNRLVVDLNNKENPSRKTGFDRNVEPKEIVNAKLNAEGKLVFIMSWKGIRETDEILAEEANLKCPQRVIDFYERRIMWCNTI